MEGSVGIFASWFRDADQTLSQMPRTFIFCGLASTIPRETVLDELHDVLLERHIFVADSHCDYYPFS